MLLVPVLLAAAAAQVPLEVSANHAVERGKPVEVDLELPPGAGIVRVVEDGNEIPWQLDGGSLTFLLGSGLKAGQRRRVTVHLGSGAAAVAPRVKVGELDHAGQRSLKIETDNATYLYHMDGAGFASLYDKDGNDWITYRPGGGSAGEYRGIPNLGVYAHPGYAGESGGTSTVEARGPIRVRVRSESRDGGYVTIWDFFPQFARLTLAKAALPYWFLYEGTPGGKLDLDSDFVVTSTGLRRPVSESWSGDLPGPEWVYFGDGRLKRALFLANHEDDEANDQFWPMEGNMTVFGFGREYRCCGRYMTAAPAQFTIGLLEDPEFARARVAVESAWRRVDVKVAPSVQ